MSELTLNVQVTVFGWSESLCNWDELSRMLIVETKKGLDKLNKLKGVPTIHSLVEVTKTAAMADDGVDVLVFFRTDNDIAGSIEAQDQYLSLADKLCAMLNEMSFRAESDIVSAMIDVEGPNYNLSFHIGSCD